MVRVSSKLMVCCIAVERCVSAEVVKLLNMFFAEEVFVRMNVVPVIYVLCL